MSAAGFKELLAPQNLLSLSRVPLGGLFWVVLGWQPPHPLPPFGLLAAAGLTDVLDGWVARRRGGAHPAGAGSWLDPICDKLFVGAVLAALYLQRHVPLSLLALIVARELLQLPMVLVYRTSHTLRRWLRYDFRASVLGKAATVSQFLAVSALLLGPAAGAWPWRLAALSFALGVLALTDYVRRAVAIGRQRLHSPESPR